MESSSYASRKFWFSAGTLISVFMTGVVSAWWPSFKAGLDTVVGAEVMILGLYLGGNLGNKWISGPLMKNRTPRSHPEEVETPEPDPAPKKTKPKE